MPPEPITRSVIIDAARDAIWAEIDRPRHLERFHPFVDKNPVFSWQPDDRRDRIEYFSGLVLDRTFLEWEPEQQFLLEIGPADQPPSNHVHWTLDHSDGVSTFAISIRPLDERDTDAEYRELLATYLDSVLGGLKHVVETGTAVQRNQFGPHPYFSPPI